MKIKIKAAVILNPREASVIAGILGRTTGAKGNAVAAPSEHQREEEQRVVHEFLSQRLELERRLG